MSFDGLPIGALRLPPTRDGEFLKTLHQWGELPDVVPVPEVAALLSSLTGQNQAALLKVLERAILGRHVHFFGLTNRDEWAPGMMRVLMSRKGKPKIRPPSAADTTTRFTATFEPTGRLHVEAMGLRPADAVTLLVKRGRKIPPELCEFVPADQAAATPEPAPIRALPAGLAYWKAVLYQRIVEIDKRHPPAATARQAIAYLKRLGDPRLTPGSGDTQSSLGWRTDAGDPKSVSAKTIKNALPIARRWAAD